MGTITRRRFIRAATVGAAALAAGGSALAGKRDFSFIVINDTHYKDAACGEYFRSAFSWVRENADYAFALIAGDLATDGKLDELQGMKQALGALGAPCYPVPGNHDYSEAYENWKSVFGEDRLNYRFDHRGWTFLGLDSSHETKSAGVSIQQPTIDWLTKTLRKVPKRRPIVAFTHFPFGKLVPLRLGNAEEVLALFDAHNLVHIFSGHFHALTERAHGSAGLTTDRCLSFSRNNHDGSKEKGFFQAQVRDGALSYEFVEYKHEA